MTTNPARPKRLFRFSIAALLFVMFFTCGYLSGYRVGFNRGDQDAENSNVYIVGYPVGDLLPVSGPPKSADFDQTIDVIVKTVAPSSWMETGKGSGTVRISSAEHVESD